MMKTTGASTAHSIKIAGLVPLTLGDDVIGVVALDVIASDAMKFGVMTSGVTCDVMRLEVKCDVTFRSACGVMCGVVGYDAGGDAVRFKVAFNDDVKASKMTPIPTDDVVVLARGIAR